MSQRYAFSFGPAIALALLTGIAPETSRATGRRRPRDTSCSCSAAIGYLAKWKALARILTGKGGWAKAARVKETAPAPACS